MSWRILVGMILTADRRARLGARTRNNRVARLLEQYSFHGIGGKNIAATPRAGAVNGSFRRGLKYSLVSAQFAQTFAFEAIS
jgi:hypothetical protein